MPRGERMRWESGGPRAGRRPKTPSPSVPRWGRGLGDLPGSPLRRDRGAPGRRGGCASERRPQDLFPPAPPSRGALASPGPSSGRSEPSSRRRTSPAAKLAGGCGGVMEETPPVGAHGSWRALGSGGGAPAGERAEDRGSARAPCRRKCATGWGGRSHPPPEPAGLKGERPQDSRRFPEPHRLVDQRAFLPHFGPARPPTPFHRFGEEPWLTKKASGLESRAHLATTALGRRNWVSLSQSATQFTLFHPPQPLRPSQ